MVKVRDDYPLTEKGEVDIESWVESLGKKVKFDKLEKVFSACRLAHDLDAEAARGHRAWGKSHSSYLTGLEMAQILADLRLDQETIVASILYRSVREELISLDKIKEEFGEGVGKLIQGVLQMAAISSIHHPLKGYVLGQTEGQYDNIRKMLVTMIDDVRVVLIKLAERTCAIRAIKDADIEKRKRVAQEVFDIYAPLAHRLGIGHIKWELEDLSFRYIYSTAYKKIAKLLDERRQDREQFIERVLNQLQEALDKESVKAEISGRAKHIYSIWRKMHRKHLDFSQIYDIRAFRILVDELGDCYKVLGIVHSLWGHIPNEFDDYIANPKENGYQSLHTAVVGPGGKIMEIQIRTHAMHEEAELGVCAHWLYKGTDVKTKSTSYEEKINWLRQVLEWQEDIGDLSGIVDELKTDVSSDRVYVFTPKGHVLDLPQGATPLDFAYRIHTNVGHACRGAKVNGRIVPLTYPLKTGDQVQVLTSKNPAPSRDWLNGSLGYIQTSRARAKVTHWFKMQNREQNIIDGRALLEDEFSRLSLDDIRFLDLAKKVNYETADDMFAAIGAGDLRPTHVANIAQQMIEPQQTQLSLPLNTYKKNRSEDNDIEVLGVGKLMTTLASCCNPVPGDPVVGFITVGRGVSIHHEDCSNLQHLQQAEPNRIIEVAWGARKSTYPVNIVIQAYDREGLLRDITNILSNEKINVLAVNTQSDENEYIATLSLKIEISSLEDLGRLLSKVKHLPNVVEAFRIRI
jgi:GTP pyrophosphokinase